MLVLKIALIIVGILFICFGYVIYFKGKYNLINGYETAKKARRLDDAYAQRIGKIEFFGGLIWLVFGIISIFLGNRFTVIIFVISLVVMLSTLIFNQITSYRGTK